MVALSFNGTAPFAVLFVDLLIHHEVIVRQFQTFSYSLRSALIVVWNERARYKFLVVLATIFYDQRGVVKTDLIILY